MRQVYKWEIIDYFFTGISKFGSFKKHFAIITRLSKLHFRCTKLIFLVQKEVISMHYAAVKGIYASIPT